MSGVAVLSPGYPEREGGVTDHTRRLAANWATMGRRVEVITSLRTPPATLVHQLLERDVRGVLIQYVPFLYGRRGLSSYPERFCREARARGVRVTVFVHEPWVPPTRLPWLLLSPMQRRQLRRLLAAADAAATPVPAWQTMLQPAPELIYVGSTLGAPPHDLGEGSPLPGPVVFSPLATGLRWEWIDAAVRRIGVTPGLVAVGAAANEIQAHRAVGRWYRPEWEWCPRLSAGNVMRHLARARLVLAPFVDGLTGRRTSAMAALAAGARLLSSPGPLFDPFFAGGPVTLAETRERFADLAATLWQASDDPDARAQRMDWYRRHLDPERLDARLLQLVTSGGKA